MTEAEPAVRLPVRRCGVFRTVALGSLRRRAAAASAGTWWLAGDRVSFRAPADSLEAWAEVWGQMPTIRVGDAVFLASAGAQVGDVFSAEVDYLEGAWPVVGASAPVIAENRPYARVGDERLYLAEEELLKRSVWRALGAPLAFGTAIRELPAEVLWAAYTVEGQLEVDSFDGPIRAGTRYSVLVAGRSWEGDVGRCLAAELGARGRVRVRAGTRERGPDPTGIEELQSDVADEGLRTLVLDVEIDR